MGQWLPDSLEDPYNSYVAGPADHFAGSTDEAVARQFDDEEGGGFADYNTWAGIGDHAAGSIDESIGRQFDDTPGGGFADETAATFWGGASGLADWAAGDVDEYVGQQTNRARNLGAYLAAGIALVAVALSVVGGGK